MLKYTSLYQLWSLVNRVMLMWKDSNEGQLDKDLESWNASISTVTSWELSASLRWFHPGSPALRIPSPGIQPQRLHRYDPWGEPTSGKWQTWHMIRESVPVWSQLYGNFHDMCFVHRLFWVHPLLFLFFKYFLLNRLHYCWLCASLSFKSSFFRKRRVWGSNLWERVKGAKPIGQRKEMI